MYLCYLCNQASELSDALGIPLSCILPVKNYSQELDLDQDTDTLLFGAVQHMLNFADSFFENQAEIQEGNDQMELYRSSDISRPDFWEQREHQIIWNPKHISVPNHFNSDLFKMIN